MPTLPKLTVLAEASKIKAIGLSEAEVTKQKTDAMGTEQYAIVRVAEALASHGIKLVPDILVSGKDGGGNGMIDALIGSEMLKKLQPYIDNISTSFKKLGFIST
jgi:hypothetical protein